MSSEILSPLLPRYLNSMLQRYALVMAGTSPSQRNVALLRGINVGTAKAVAMTDLAAVFESLGATGVKTVLRSGNVAFAGSLQPKAIEEAVFDATGVRSSVVVIDAATFRKIADADPLTGIATNGSKSFVTFLSEPPGALELPSAESLAPEQIAVAGQAIYQWFPDGSQQTKVPKSFWKQFSGHVTARNRNTVEKLLALLES
jgi:uncharacterized protein (DUF1697 family)